MGYLTEYKLSYDILDEKVFSESEKKFRKECEEKGIVVPECLAFADKISVETSLENFLNDYRFSNYGPLINFVNSNAEECKWYEHVEDMKKLSILFPTVLFTLKGIGEETGDMWVKYFLDGKVQIANARIEFDKFDKSKLV